MKRKEREGKRRSAPLIRSHSLRRTSSSLVTPRSDAEAITRRAPPSFRRCASSSVPLLPSIATRSDLHQAHLLLASYSLHQEASRYNTSLLPPPRCSQPFPASCRCQPRAMSLVTLTPSLCCNSSTTPPSSLVLAPSCSVGSSLSCCLFPDSFRPLLPVPLSRSPHPLFSAAPPPSSLAFTLSLSPSSPTST